MTTAAKGWMWLALSLTLLIGIALGVAIDRLAFAPTVQSSGSVDVQNNERDRRSRDHGRQFLARLREELGLTDEQQEAFEGVLAASREKARLYRDSSRQQYRELRERFRADIRAILTEEQKAIFNRMLEEHDLNRHRGKKNR